MKTTNNKHIIKDKLQGVDLPDMEASWQKMEQTIEAGGVVQGGWSAFIAKYKIYLNLFVAITTIGLVGLLVKSKTFKSKFSQQDVPSYAGELAYKLSYLSFNTELNHDNDLPIPSGPMNNKIKRPSLNKGNDLALLPYSEFDRDTAQNAPVLVTETVDTQDTTPVEEEVTITTIGDIHLQRDYPKPEVYVHNQVGIKIQAGVFPDVSVQNAIQSTGFAVYARRFITERTAIHLEVGYNPIIIRPITYVEKYNLFNNVNYAQTDSAIVKRLKYVTIPINLYHQIRPGWSVNIGPQISFLTGMSGDLTRKLSYPTAPETDNETVNRSITNRGGFNTTDIGFNVGISRHLGRIELGVNVQTSLSDYTNETLSTQTHRFNTLQIKAAWLLNN